MPWFRAATIKWIRCCPWSFKQLHGLFFYCNSHRELLCWLVGITMSNSLLSALWVMKLVHVIVIADITETKTILLTWGNRNSEGELSPRSHYHPLKLCQCQALILFINVIAFYKVKEHMKTERYNCTSLLVGKCL